MRRPQANPSERFIKEIGTFFKICCFQNHRRWPELLRGVEEWLIHTMADSAGFCALELIFNVSRPDLFKKFLKKDADQLPPDESLSDKVLRAYLKMKLKAGRRKKRQKRGQHEWKPQLGDLVLYRCQPVSEAAKGVTSKFTRPYEGPWRLTKLIPPYEISSLNGRVRGVFHKEALKPYQKTQSHTHVKISKTCLMRERRLYRERLLVE